MDLIVQSWTWCPSISIPWDLFPFWQSCLSAAGKAIRSIICCEPKESLFRNDLDELGFIVSKLLVRPQIYIMMTLWLIFAKPQIY